MELLYRGFDGLDVSFSGQISHKLCDALEAAKDRAQQTHQGAPLSWNGVRMEVSEIGARGGYAYVARTGMFGATWWFKKPNPRDPWGVRVSCNSFNLATNGLGRARAELYTTMDLLGIVKGSDGESVSRVDFALDFLEPKLVLIPEHFVMHSNACRTDHIEHPEVTVHGRSGRVTSVTVGKMPGRQIIVYDKRAEVIAKRKVGWWEIWNAARASTGLPPLNVEDADDSRVWRVELRAGKKHLKDRWNIRTWADLYERFGDMVAAMIGAVRYTQPSEDSNRSRWPDSQLWQKVRKEAEADLFEMRSWADPDLVKQVQNESHDRMLASQMTGLLTSRAALCGIQPSQLPAFATAIGGQMAEEIAQSPARFEQKLASAIDRYGVATASRSQAGSQRSPSESCGTFESEP